MRWFGRKAGQGARPSLFGGWAGHDARPFSFQAPGEVQWPSGYEAQVREAYLGNAVAQRAVRLVAEAAASATIYALEGDEAAVRIAAAPGLIEAAATQLLLHGNAFLQVVGDAEAMPAELFPLRPERVRIEPGPSGWPAAYLYKVSGATTRLPAVDPLGRPSVVHLRGFHPLDDHLGLGCLGAAAPAVAVHNAAARWNKALLDNAARPSGALVYEPGDGAALSGEQFERLRAEMEAAFQGAGNAGRPMLLEGGLRWQALSLTPAEMDFAGLKAAAAREIALAFGVPPMLLGLPGDATYANYREANRALWRLTVLPLLEKMLGGMAAGLAHWWPGLRLAVDLDQVTALAEDRERLWAQVSAADFLSAAEKREMLGFGAEAAG